MIRLSNALLSFLGLRRAVDCPSTQEVRRARDEAYRKRHAQLLAELSGVVGKPLSRVEKIVDDQNVSV